MGKNKSKTPEEHNLRLPEPPTSAGIVDTHTHLASTFETYRQKYRSGKYETVYDFVRGLYEGRHIEAVVDVWCEAPVIPMWKDLADSAQNGDKRWGGLEYWFVMG